METNLTKQMIEDVIKVLKKNQVNNDHILRIHPSSLELAYDLGLCPFCPLTENDYIEFECGNNITSSQE